MFLETARCSRSFCVVTVWGKGERVALFWPGRLVSLLKSVSFLGRRLGLGWRVKGGGWESSCVIPAGSRWARGPSCGGFSSHSFPILHLRSWVRFRYWALWLAECCPSIIAGMANPHINKFIHLGLKCQILLVVSKFPKFHVSFLLWFKGTLLSSRFSFPVSVLC